METFSKKQSRSAQPISCPSCGNSVTEITYIYKDGDDNSDFFRCPDCTFLFARPVFIPELYCRQMDGIENAELFNSRLLKSIYVNYFIKKEIRALRRAKGRGPLRLLDIGCGTGWTTRVYADHGFDVTGLEPSRVRSEYARENYGIEVVCDYIENAGFDQEFDVVVLRHIIEHFADPGAVLRKIRGFLKADGVVLVVVPNIDCLGRYLFETDWAWVLPWHCNFFTPRSARRFLTEQGFEVSVFYQTPSPLYYPGAMIRTFPNRFVKGLMGHNRVVSMALCTPLAIAGKWLGIGDNLNVVARLTDDVG
ncbi:MAG: class I SAM-dependent methyltransferase [Desulfuromonadales bacterium]